jgi:hypothetical protein
MAAPGAAPVSSRLTAAAQQLRSALSTLLDNVESSGGDPDARAKRLAPFIRARADVLRGHGFASDAEFTAAADAAAAGCSGLPADTAAATAAHAVAQLRAQEGRWARVLAALEAEAAADDGTGEGSAGAAAAAPPLVSAPDAAAAPRPPPCAAADAAPAGRVVQIGTATDAVPTATAASLDRIGRPAAAAVMQSSRLVVGDPAPAFDLPCVGEGAGHGIALRAPSAAPGPGLAAPVACATAARLSSRDLLLPRGPALLVFMRHYG